ncbi:hypothetical protein L249_1917 [Ophiocordyceps polyrhachis-furcata BCC 54312]|uniref:YCII-related domain-containing protein n=1 Tax=Ophiocordyceps polyrhachis-furcata BCC 54312 TaxID=1330021 RepID=A0A367LSI4_9HYPO|nr:hypothetical protein L249_1917 [Ophiocordyceps polyrhachis-furcata BCC 54312]
MILLIARHRLALPRIPIPLRAMASSSSAAITHEFLVIIPDKPGSQAKRKQIRPLTRALLNSLPVDDDPSSLDFAGSALVCRAQSENHARSLLAEDIYSTEGVWDLEKVVAAC